MKVSAMDKAGNVSAFSSSLTAKTISSTPVPDVSSPTVPSSLKSTSITPTSFVLKWNQSTDTQSEIQKYEIYLDGSLYKSSTSNYLQIKELQPNSEYIVKVRALDIYNNASAFSSDLTVYTLSTTSNIDTTAPEKISSLSASFITTSSFLLSWSAATDDVKVDRYEILQGQNYIGETNSTFYSVQGLESDTSYSMSVVAYDESDNASDPIVINVTTLKKEDFVVPKMLTRQISLNSFGRSPVVKISQIRSSDLADMYLDGTNLDIEMREFKKDVSLIPNYPKHIVKFVISGEVIPYELDFYKDVEWNFRDNNTDAKKQLNSILNRVNIDNYILSTREYQGIQLSDIVHLQNICDFTNISLDESLSDQYFLAHAYNSNDIKDDNNFNVFKIIVRSDNDEIFRENRGRQFVLKGGILHERIVQYPDFILVKDYDENRMGSVFSDDKIVWIKKSKSELPSLGRTLSIDYDVDATIEDLQQQMDLNRILTADVLIKQSKKIYVDFFVDLKCGYKFTPAQTKFEIIDAVKTYINNVKKIGSRLELSGLISFIRNLESVSFINLDKTKIFLRGQNFFEQFNDYQFRYGDKVSTFESKSHEHFELRNVYVNVKGES
jgi:chitodextrinase